MPKQMIEANRSRRWNAVSTANQTRALISRMTRRAPKKPNSSLEKFMKDTGIEVDYKTVIDDNESFFGTIREPLASGQGTGWDMIVITDWLVAKMAGLGYLEPLDHDLLENYDAHGAAIYKDTTYDPGNRYRQNANDAPSCWVQPIAGSLTRFPQIQKADYSK